MQLKSKCEKEEFKTGFYRVEESLKDATKSLTIAAHERKQHNAAISEQERVLTTLKNGLESMEAAVQLGGAVTQEDLTKVAPQLWVAAVVRLSGRQYSQLRSIWGAVVALNFGRSCGYCQWGSGQAVV